MDIEGGRSEYVLGQLDEASVDTNPILELRKWIQHAVDAQVVEPTAMALATVSEQGNPSVRMVLLRGIDDAGLCFYTNYDSRKACELGATHRAAVCFWWGQLERQIRVEGRVERLTEEESAAYFSTRPKASQIAAHASPQSQVLLDRDELDRLYQAAVARYPDEVPKPDNWGGYRLVPDAFEFWQGRRSRLHDRLRYRQEPGLWIVERLAP